MAVVIITTWLWEVSYTVVLAIICSPRKIGAYLLLYYDYCGVFLLLN